MYYCKDEYLSIALNLTCFEPSLFCFFNSNIFYQRNHYSEKRVVNKKNTFMCECEDNDTRTIYQIFFSVMNLFRKLTRRNHQTKA